MSLSPALARLRQFSKVMYATQVQSFEENSAPTSSFLEKALGSVGLGFMVSCCNQPAGNTEEVHLLPVDAQPPSNFAVGTRILDKSRTHHCWLPTLIIDVNDAGDVELEIKPRVWISPSEQTTLLRTIR